MSLTQQKGRFIEDGAITAAKVDPTFLASLSRTNLANAFAAANIAGTYANGTAGVGATITATGNGAFPNQDGVVSYSGMHVFLTNQTSAAHNGLYVLTQLGSGGTPYILTRATSMNTPGGMALGTPVFVSAEGTYYAASIWMASGTAVAVIGTDDLTFGTLQAFFDAIMVIRNFADPTKAMNFNTINVTAGNTREVTMADRTVDLDLVTNEAVEYVTLSGTDITNKYYDLANVPRTAAKTKLAVKGSGPLFYTDDFTVITNGSLIKRLNWSTLGLDGVLIAGDKLQVTYLYD